MSARTYTVYSIVSFVVYYRVLLLSVLDILFEEAFPDIISDDAAN